MQHILTRLLLWILDFIVLWSIPSIIINRLFYIMVGEKYNIIIKLPKHRKYKDKVDPIYELRQSEFSTMMYIHQWELGYATKVWLKVLNVFIFPYPIDILFYGYYENPKIIVVGDISQINRLKNDLKTIYEDKINEEHKQWLRENRDNIALENKINELNKVFKENYE